MGEQTRAKLAWQSGLRFSAEPGSGHGLTIDSVARPGHAGPGPMELIVMGIAGCTAMDVVSILEKMRQPLSGLEVEIVGDRAEQHPKHLRGIAIVYRVRGQGLSREKVERAVELSHSTYCSAVASLRENCKVTTSVEITEA
ncbi:MAG: OsmC family protein [Thermoanaerobaculaceae bacterium]|nr:OsmC family protein [Thermoanaerobaculaceae bacterium]